MEWWGTGPVGDFFHKHNTSRAAAARIVEASIQSVGHYMRGDDSRLGQAKRQKLVDHLSATSGRRWTLAKLNAARAKLAAIHPIKENLA